MAHSTVEAWQAAAILARQAQDQISNGRAAAAQVTIRDLELLANHELTHQGGRLDALLAERFGTGQVFS